jgi:signal transduction histidine kinase
METTEENAASCCRMARPGGSPPAGRVEFNGGTAPVAIRGVCFDITARRQAERDHARQRDELTHLSRVAMLGELSGSMAHELNQPLTAILSNAQAAQEFLSNGSGTIEEVRGIPPGYRG